MTAVQGDARVSSGEQDAAGQTMHLKEAGAMTVFTDVKSGKSMDCPVLRGGKARFVFGSRGRHSSRSGGSRPKCGETQLSGGRETPPLADR